MRDLSLDKLPAFQFPNRPLTFEEAAKQSCSIVADATGVGASIRIWTPVSLKGQETGKQVEITERYDYRTNPCVKYGELILGGHFFSEVEIGLRVDSLQKIDLLNTASVMIQRLLGHDFDKAIDANSSLRFESHEEVLQELAERCSKRSCGFHKSCDFVKEGWHVNGLGSCGISISKRIRHDMFDTYRHVFDETHKRIVGLLPYKRSDRAIAAEKVRSHFLDPNLSKYVMPFVCLTAGCAGIFVQGTTYLWHSETRCFEESNINQLLDRWGVGYLFGPSVERLNKLASFIRVVDAGYVSFLHEVMPQNARVRVAYEDGFDDDADQGLAESGSCLNRPDYE